MPIIAGLRMGYGSHLEVEPVWLKACFLKATSGGFHVSVSGCKG